MICYKCNQMCKMIYDIDSKYVTAGCLTCGTRNTYTHDKEMVFCDDNLSAPNNKSIEIIHDLPTKSLEVISKE